MIRSVKRRIFYLRSDIYFYLLACEISISGRALGWGSVSRWSIVRHKERLVPGPGELRGPSRCSGFSCLVFCLPGTGTGWNSSLQHHVQWLLLDTEQSPGWHSQVCFVQHLSVTGCDVCSSAKRFANISVPFIGRLLFWLLKQAGESSGRASTPVHSFPSPAVTVGGRVGQGRAWSCLCLILGS